MKNLLDIFPDGPLGGCLAIVATWIIILGVASAITLAIALSIE
jgi:hypothetical protein